MSRTDKDQPYWVRAMHADQDGHATTIWHSRYCVEHEPITGRRYNYLIRAVPSEQAAKQGWAIDDRFPCTRPDWVIARIPYGPFECDIDTATSRCGRSMTHHDHHGHCCGFAGKAVHDEFYGPDRAHVRDTLRAAVKEWNSARVQGCVEDPYDADLSEPVNRQGRHSPWYGGWWD